MSYLALVILALFIHVRQLLSPLLEEILPQRHLKLLPILRMGYNRRSFQWRHYRTFNFKTLFTFALLPLIRNHFLHFQGQSGREALQRVALSDRRVLRREA